MSFYIYMIYVSVYLSFFSCAGKSFVSCAWLRTDRQRRCLSVRNSWRKMAGKSARLPRTRLWSWKCTCSVGRLTDGMATVGCRTECILQRRDINGYEKIRGRFFCLDISPPISLQKLFITALRFNRGVCLLSLSRSDLTPNGTSFCVHVLTFYINRWNTLGVGSLKDLVFSVFPGSTTQTFSSW